MSMWFRTAVIAGAAVLLTHGAAIAQQVSVTFDDGRVSIEARNATVREILDEWSRIGDVTIVGGDKINSAPMTLALSDVAERAVLDTLLRDVSGYVLSARSQPSTRSAYAHIFILATSVAPAPEEEEALVELFINPKLRGNRLPPRMPQPEIGANIVEATGAEPVAEEEARTSPAEAADASRPPFAAGAISNVPPVTTSHTNPPSPPGTPVPTSPAGTSSTRPGIVMPLPPTNPYGPTTTQSPPPEAR
jgi:hypothetical protein